MNTDEKNAVVALNHSWKDPQRVSAKLKLDESEVISFTTTGEYKDLEKTIKPQGGGWDYPPGMWADFNAVSKRAK